MPSLLTILLAACGADKTQTTENGLSEATPPESTSSTETEASPPFADVTLTLNEAHANQVIVSWSQLVEAEVFIEYSFDADIWLRAPSQQTVGASEDLLVGIPYAVDVTLRLSSDDGSGAIVSEDYAITTADLPAGLPQARVTMSDPESWDADAPYLLTCLDETAMRTTSWSVIIDRMGRVVWARETPSDFTTMYVQLSRDGTELLIDHNSFWEIFDGGEASEVVRMTLDGTVVETHPTPGLHHAFTEVDDGLVWGAADGMEETLEHRNTDGVQETVWSCREHIEDVGGVGACGTNALHYAPESDSVLFSFYSIESVVEIDLSTGESLRQFGHLEGSWSWGEDTTPFWWQHGACYTPDGTLLVSSEGSREGEETVVREYALDDDTQTLTEVWSFGVGEGVYGYQMGEPRRLSGGNTLHNYGHLARVREATPSGEVVWDVEWPDGEYMGRMTPITDLYALLD